MLPWLDCDLCANQESRHVIHILNGTCLYNALYYCITVIFIVSNLVPIVQLFLNCTYYSQLLFVLVLSIMYKFVTYSYQHSHNSHHFHLLHMSLREPSLQPFYICIFYEVSLYVLLSSITYIFSTADKLCYYQSLLMA